MKGLGLYGGILAVVALVDDADPVERPDTAPFELWRREAPGGLRALGVVDKYDSAEHRALEEDYAVRWAAAYPGDIVMVVEVMA